VKPRLPQCVLALVSVASALLAQGQVFWQEGGVVVCDFESGWGVGQAVASDDSGGAFVVWNENRRENGSIWAQYMDRDGNAVWQQNGVFVAGGNPNVNQLSAISDGAGGLVAVWQELFPYERHQITAQRLDATGTVLWDSSGVVVAGSMSRYEVAAASDGRGGAIVAWVVAPSESAAVDSLVVQRLDSLGRPCWGSPGLVVATDTLDVYPPRICSDGSGGVYIAWATVLGTEYRVLAQRVDDTGTPAWPSPGVQALTLNYVVADAVAASDGVVVLGRMAARIRAQSLDSIGRSRWGPDGRQVYAGSGFFWGPVVGIDVGVCGTYVVWTEKRGDVYDVYSQLLDTAGYRMWDTLGVRVGTVNSSDGQEITCVSDGKTGFIVSWPEHSDSTGSWDVYAERVDSAGQLRWGASGLGVAVDSGWQSRPIAVTDARGGAIVVWVRSYAGDSIGLSAQRIGDGPTGLAESNVTPPPISHWIYLNPVRPGATISLPPCGEQSVSLGLLDACGRKVMDLHPGANDVRALAPGVYFVRTAQAQAQAQAVRKVVLTE